MANCKEDFLKEVKDKEILCANILLCKDYYIEGSEKISRLKIGFSHEDLSYFLNDIDYEYDDGFGGQEVFGFIWYMDGTWSERKEYDGSEWWEYKKCPEIPIELTINIK